HGVHVLAGFRARGEAPFGHAHALVVDLNRGNGLGQVRHRRSSGKNLNTERTGLGAAWPKPQIEASPMTWPRSACRSASQLPAASNCTAFSVPLRQGVH